MSVFISYSHNDMKFTEKLSAHLIKENIQIWMDEIELNIGDSMIEEIEKGLKTASYLCVILSKSFVESNWCRKELNAGFMKEIESKKVVILPILIEDCEIPLLLQDKLYADFRNDFDKPLNKLLNTLAKHTNDTLGRVKSTGYYTDYALDWGVYNNKIQIQIHAVSFAEQLSYSVLTTITITGNEIATQKFNLYAEQGLGYFGKNLIVEFLSVLKDEKQMMLKIENDKPSIAIFDVGDLKLSLIYHIELNSRRLGEDHGKDLALHFGSIFGDIREDMKLKSKKPSDEEVKTIKYILLENNPILKNRQGKAGN